MCLAILIQFVTTSWCYCKCLRGQRYNLVRTRKCNKHGGRLISWFTWKLPKAKYSSTQPFNDPPAEKGRNLLTFSRFYDLEILEHFLNLLFPEISLIHPQGLHGNLNAVFVLLILSAESPWTRTIYHLWIWNSGKPFSFEAMLRFWIQYWRNECYVLI